MMTTEGWMSVMYNGIDATGVDMQPKKNNQTYFVAYFVAYMIIGSQFIINLFVGVVIDNFTKIKEKEEMGGKGVFITDSQKRWLEIRKVMLNKGLMMDVPSPTATQKIFRVKNLLLDELGVLSFPLCVQLLFKVLGNGLVVLFKPSLLCEGSVESCRNQSLQNILVVDFALKFLRIVRFWDFLDLNV